MSTSEEPSVISIDSPLTQQTHENYQHFATATELHVARHLPHKFLMDSSRLHDQQTTFHEFRHQGYITQQQHQLYCQQHRYFQNESYRGPSTDTNHNSNSAQPTLETPYITNTVKFLNNLDKCIPLKLDQQHRQALTISQAFEKEVDQHILVNTEHVGKANASNYAMSMQPSPQLNNACLPRGKYHIDSKTITLRINEDKHCQQGTNCEQGQTKKKIILNDQHQQVEAGYLQK
ncbi:unnamed protein product [Ceratitis capitata]|uniref:(Mediterranean fruit fly) hypothetical protein n=1 Tax=Ceratitis capitata TaxID=7213 RepID=A0A811UPJ7_CERCA|nr:unnamed protein product [Ceratitis capitata]